MDALDIFAGNLRRLREERDLTQEQLALDAGLQPTDIRRLEGRGRDPKLRTLAKIAGGLGVDLCTLLDGIEPEND